MRSATSSGTSTSARTPRTSPIGCAASPSGSSSTSSPVRWPTAERRPGSSLAGDAPQRRKGLRHAAAVLIAQLGRRKAPVEQAHERLVVAAGFEHQLDLAVEARAVQAGLGGGQDEPAGTVDDLEHVPVAVELVRGGAELDAPHPRTRRSQVERTIQPGAGPW